MKKFLKFFFFNGQMSMKIPTFKAKKNYNQPKHYEENF